MNDMIYGLSTIIKYEVKGKIGLGCKAVRTSCSSCRKTVTALKTGNEFICPVCDSICTPKSGEREFPQVSPFFIVPEEMKSVLGAKPTKLRVIPARDEIDRAFPTSWAKHVKSGERFCTGNAVEADRYDTAKKDTVKVPCDPKTCPDVLNKSCKPGGTFYIILPDFDAFSAYKIVTHSHQSIVNIMSELNKLRKGQGSNKIAQPICELSIVKKKKPDGTVYHILQFFLPAVPLSALRSGKGPLSLAFTPSNDEGSDDNAGRINGEGVIDITAASVETAPQKEAAAPSDIPADENVRLEKGRKAVKEKIKLFVKGQYVDRALEIHLCERYGAGQFEALSVANLLESWHGIKEGSEIVDKVWNLAGKLRHGVTEELPLQKTA